MSVYLCGRISSAQELVEHPQFEPEVKRAILASWASDACAVPSHPSLRRPPELPGPVQVDEVLAALRSLDGSTEGSRAPA
jgi:acetyl esterase/lipase